MLKKTRKREITEHEKKEYNKKEIEEKKKIMFRRKKSDFTLLLTEMLCSIFNEFLMDDCPTMHS